MLDRATTQEPWPVGASGCSAVVFQTFCSTQISQRRACWTKQGWGTEKSLLLLVIGLVCRVGTAYHLYRLVTPDNHRFDPTLHPDPRFPPDLGDLFVNGQPDELGPRQSRFQHGADVGTCACSELEEHALRVQSRQTTRILGRRLRPRNWPRAMICGFASRRSDSGCGRKGSGRIASSVCRGSTSPATAARAWVS